MFQEQWSAEKVQQLTELWTAGTLSASQIAKQLGGFEHCKDGGRSSVMGKVFRLGLSQSKAAKTSDEIKAEKAARRERKLVLQRSLYDLNREKIIEERRAERAAAEVARLIEVERFQQERSHSSMPFGELRPFSERLSNQCRFIINEGAISEYLACGAVTAPGDAWCGHCRDIVMAKPAAKISDEERMRRALAFKKNVISRKAA